MLVTKENIVLDNMENFFNALEDILLVLDESESIIHANASALSKLGYTLEQLHRMNILHVYPVEKREEVREVLFGMLHGTFSICQHPLLNSSGTYRSADAQLFKGSWNGKNALYYLINS